MNTDKDCYRPLFSVPSTSSLSSLLHLTNRKSDSWYPQYFEACVFLLCNYCFAMQSFALKSTRGF